jgi:hypothetical protein
MRKLIHTAQSPSEFNVEEQLLKSCDWEKPDELFLRYFNLILCPLRLSLIEFKLLYER